MNTTLHVIQNMIFMALMLVSFILEVNGKAEPLPDAKDSNAAMYSYIGAGICGLCVLGAVFVCYRMGKSDDGSDDDNYEKN